MIDQEYILKVIKEEVTAEERERFFAQFAQDPGLAEEYARVKNSYVIRNLPYTPSIESLLSGRKPKRNILLALTRIAAVLFIPLSVYFIYNTAIKKPTASLSGIAALYEAGTGVKYQVNTGVKATFVLPDSTQVWLNSGSTLHVPDDFSKDNRLVFLSGEGYFDVESDEHSPFLVRTPQELTVKVTGTEFNLSCYESDKQMRLTLLEGELELIRERDNKVFQVKPNEQFIVDYASLKEQQEVADTDYAIAWKEGYLRFEDTPMDEVVRRLERWYGVHVLVGNPAILEHSFTADFESESVLQVLALMEMTLNISYEIEGNRIRLNL